MKSCFKQTVNQKGNYWWQIGKNKENKLWLPKKWIHVGKTSEGWEVRADEKINKETIYGHSKFYKSKPSAMKFANKYMKENC